MHLPNVRVTSSIALVLGLLVGCQSGGSAIGAREPAAQVPLLRSTTKRDGPLLRAAENARDAYLRDLATLVNIDSGTGEEPGLSRVGDFLARRLHDLGATVEVVAAPSPSVGNVIRGTLAGTGNSKLMLMVHFDTVFASGEAAKRPFRIDGHRAYGPGVADAKGGVAMILHALAIARERGFKDYKTLTVLFTPDEEKGSLGTHDIIARLSAEQDVVLSYEPPDADRVIVATRGVAYVELDVKGRASHAGAAPEKGRNAAVELAGQIMQLRDLGDAAKGTTVNWTVLKSGDRANVIPDSAAATADMRINDVSEIARVQDDARRIIGKRVVPDTQVTVDVTLRRPPFVKNELTDRLVTVAQGVYGELDRSLEPVSMGFGTDAGFAFQPGRDHPAVLEGLGIVGGGLHAPEEWAELDSIAPRLYLTVRMLELLGAKPPATP